MGRKAFLRSFFLVFSVQCSVSGIRERHKNEELREKSTKTEDDVVPRQNPMEASHREL